MKTVKDALSKLELPTALGLAVSLLSFAVLFSCESEALLKIACAPAVFLFLVLKCFVPARITSPEWNMIAFVTVLEILVFNGMFWAFGAMGAIPRSRFSKALRTVFVFFVVFASFSIMASDMVAEFGVFDWGGLEDFPVDDRLALVRFSFSSFAKEVAMDSFIAYFLLRFKALAHLLSNIGKQS